ncbi:NTP transferase domain-containing protein [Corynebacterium sphenisci]|uniref:NTP transferase domain-containing protein n=1 Tax=Corynebacterium sphenisci TaxID=191493 RepID=UPI0026DEB3DD|nr:NTP transferase domain-containing protein [Corynebacterium sphenisci]MDO5730349.1 NTP transferase domain-containing protein [Corynebacterium sphenisci]
MAEPAIILAGGTGRRMGGVCKAELRLHGRRLLDHLLDDLGAAGRPAVVVGPPDLALPDSPLVTRTLEEPPLGGPAAGIAAGLAAVRARHPAARRVAVLACDAPHSARALPLLEERLAAAGGAADGAVGVDPAGRVQRLLAVVDLAALTAAVAALQEAGGVRDRSVRRLLAPLHLIEAPVPGWVRDADAPADLAALAAADPDPRP